MEKILTWLSGKKSAILGILATTVSFLILKQVIDAQTGAYIDAILTIIFGTASIATTAMYNRLK